MGVGTLRAFARRWRDRLIDLDAAEPADEDAMRGGLEDHSHRRIAGFEYGAAGVFAQPPLEIAIADTDTEIRLQRAETEIEQNGLPIFLARCLTIGAELRQHDTPVHGAIIFRQAKRDPLVPAGSGNALGCERAAGRMRFD